MSDNKMPDEIFAQINAGKINDGSWWSSDDGNTPWLTPYIKKSESIPISEIEKLIYSYGNRYLLPNVINILLDELQNLIDKEDKPNV